MIEVVKQFVENALKYSPEDAPIRVTVALKNGKIVIGVADYGPGIEENERPLIFDTFFRGRRHRFSIKGTGMGLAIAKGIAAALRRAHLGGKRGGAGRGVLFVPGARRR
jgi:two-component system sensor histidine kinase KdpD